MGNAVVSDFAPYTMLTDTFAVLGWIGGGELGYGAIRIDVAKERAVIATIANRTGMTVVAG